MFGANRCRKQIKDPIFEEATIVHTSDAVMAVDDDLVAIGSRSGRVVLLSLAKGTARELNDPHTIEGVKLARQQGAHAHASSVDHVVFSQDGRHLYTASRRPRAKDEQLKMWNVSSGKLEARGVLTGFPFSLALSPDGNQLLIGTHRAVELWVLK